MKVSAIVLGAIATTATSASAAALPFGDGEWKFPNIRIGYAGAHHDYDKRGMMAPCHQKGGAVQRSEGAPSGLGRLLASLGFDSYTVSRYEHHHKHGDGHHGHHKDHGKDGHHHGDGHMGGHMMMHGKHAEAEAGAESGGAFAPPPQDAEVRILPVFGHADEQYAEKHIAAQAKAEQADGVTGFIRSLRFDPVYLIVGYVIGGALGFVAARKIRDARRRRQAIRLDEEAPAREEAPAAEKA